MTRARSSAIALLCAVGVASAADKKDGLKNDYQAVAAAARWTFAEADSYLLKSAAGVSKPYTVKGAGDGFGDVGPVRVFRDGKEVFKFEGHPNTVLAIGDDVLYYADYATGTGGCNVIAVDLKTGGKLWHAGLKGVGRPPHFAYSNYVNLDIENAEVLKVQGDESAGRYIEFVDRKTGATVGHKRVPAGKE